MAERVVSEREKQIVKVSVIGIVTNVCLAGFKAIIGLLSNSIAIVLDAVNNLSDVISSVITIVGAKLSSKSPNKEHPYGYGRVEYLTTVVIAVIVLWAGAASLKASIVEIVTPETPSYSAVSLVIVGVAVVVKIVLGLFVKARGRALHADSLVASGQDALMDSIISASTLSAAFIYIIFGLSLEAWLGAIISLFILKAGFEIIKDATGKLLGRRVEGAFIKEIKQTICEIDGVHGAYDLILHDYGPDQLSGSVDIEVDDTVSAKQIACITHAIQDAVYEKHQVIIHTVGIYSVNTDEETLKLETDIYKLISKHEHVLQCHGFYKNPETNVITLDVVISFEAGDRQAELQKIKEELSGVYSEYQFVLTLDSDMSD